jgi:hypothetical protein
MIGLGEPEAMEDFGPCPAPVLIDWLMNVEYDCHIGISLEVHDMEVQFWESFASIEIPQPPRLANIYAAL